MRTPTVIIAALTTLACERLGLPLVALGREVRFAAVEDQDRLRAEPRLEVVPRGRVERTAGTLQHARARGGQATQEDARVLVRAVLRPERREQAELGPRRLAAEQLLLCGHLDEGMNLLKGDLAALGWNVPESPSGALAAIWELSSELKRRGFDFEPSPEADVPVELLARRNLRDAQAARQLGD